MAPIREKIGPETPVYRSVLANSTVSKVTGRVMKFRIHWVIVYTTQNNRSNS